MKNGKISNNTLSYITNVDKMRQEGYVDPNAWFEDSTYSQDTRCYEQTWYFSKLDMKLSIVRLEDDDY